MMYTYLRQLLNQPDINALITNRIENATYV